MTWQTARRWVRGLAAASCWAGLLAGSVRGEPAEKLPKPTPAEKSDQAKEKPAAKSPIHCMPVTPVDLCSALRLAGVENPQVLLARQRVVEAVAEEQFAAVQILPNLNAGFNYNSHDGALQRSDGSILRVDRSALYAGLGANAVGAGTVNVPGLQLAGNVSEGIFLYLRQKQVTVQRQFGSVAVRNQVFLDVARAYCELLRAECAVKLAEQNVEQAAEVARITGEFAKAGQGRQSDADRAEAELEQRRADLAALEGDLLIASARLAELLNLDPSCRLHATDGWVVPAPLVPDPVPLCDLIAIALLQRPELGERRAAIREAILALSGARILPFSPNVILGFSTGTFGGGSDLVAAGTPGTVLGPRFGNFGGRADFDAVVYWSLRNLGVGNVALIDLARSRVRIEELRQLIVLDRVRTEVAEAYARTHARFAQIGSAQRALRVALRAFEEDVKRVRNRQGLPIELMDSLRLVVRSRTDYLNALIDYNEAQFELYVALGQPPADALARPVPKDLVAPPADAGAKMPPPNGQPCGGPPGLAAGPVAGDPKGPEERLPAPREVNGQGTKPAPAGGSPQTTQPAAGGAG
jgi:outer membrane protein TolC